MKILAAVSIFFFVSFASAQNKLDSDLGVADVNERGDVCLTIPNAKLEKGAAVQLILPDKPQTAAAAAIREKTAESCSDNPDMKSDTDSSYLLKLSKGKLKRGDVAIVLAGSKTPAKVAAGAATIDVNDDGKKDYFRVCTSQEGLWLSVWADKPLQSRRLWNRYYYLGYDVVPSCKESDFKD